MYTARVRWDSGGLIPGSEHLLWQVPSVLAVQVRHAPFHNPTAGCDIGHPEGAISTASSLGQQGCGIGAAHAGCMWETFEILTACVTVQLGLLKRSLDAASQKLQVCDQPIYVQKLGLRAISSTGASYCWTCLMHLLSSRFIQLHREHHHPPHHCCLLKGHQTPHAVFCVAAPQAVHRPCACAEGLPLMLPYSNATKVRPRQYEQ